MYCFRPRSSSSPIVVLCCVVLFLRRLLFPSSPLNESHDSCSPASSSLRIVVSALSSVHSHRPLRRRIARRVNVTAFVVLVIVVLESNQSALVVSGQPVSLDTYPSSSRNRIVAAFVVETRVHDTVGIAVHDYVVISHRKRHAAGFGGAADDTRRRPLPAASSSSLSASPKRSLYHRLSTVASSCVSAKLRKEVNDVWPAAS